MTKTHKKNVEGYVRAAFDRSWTSMLGDQRTVDILCKYAARQLADAVLEAQQVESMTEWNAQWWSTWVASLVEANLRSRLVAGREKAAASAAWGAAAASAASADQLAPGVPIVTLKPALSPQDAGSEPSRAMSPEQGRIAHEDSPKHSRSVSPSCPFVPDFSAGASPVREQEQPPDRKEEKELCSGALGAEKKDAAKSKHGERKEGKELCSGALDAEKKDAAKRKHDERKEGKELCSGAMYVEKKEAAKRKHGERQERGRDRSRKKERARSRRRRSQRRDRTPSGRDRRRRRERDQERKGESQNKAQPPTKKAS